LTNKSKLSESLKNFEYLNNKDEELNQKLSEFITLLDQSELDSENIKLLQNKINVVIDKKLSKKKVIKEIKEVSLADIDQFEQLDKLEFLLNNHHLDSRSTKKITLTRKFLRVIQILIGFLFVTLGFAMIILPAPPYFEMFTIYYFNENDGVTLMDLISLIIIAAGIYIIVKSISNFRTYE